MVVLRFTFIVVSMTILAVAHQTHLIAQNGDKNHPNKFVATLHTLSAECRVFIIGNSTDVTKNLGKGQHCRDMKLDSFKSGALGVCSQDEFNMAVALVCSNDESSPKKSSHNRSWHALVESLSMECQIFVGSNSSERTGDLNRDAECSLVTSDSFKGKAFDFCTEDEYGKIADFVCSTGLTETSEQLKGSKPLNDDLDFMRQWVVLVKSFLPDCKRYILSTSTEPIGVLTHETACRRVKSESFGYNTLKSCTPDELRDLVATVCNGGSISESRQVETSITLNEDMEFTRRWVSFVMSTSKKCQEFSYRASTDLVGELPHHEACKHAQSDSFKSSALEACSRDEYDTGVALVCASALTVKSRHDKNLPALHLDHNFVKRWVAYMRTLSLECRHFSILISTGPVADMSHYKACLYYESDSFRSSALEVCSHDEYVGSVSLVCSSVSGMPQKQNSSTKLLNDKDFIQTWVPLMESLPPKCKQFFLFSNSVKISDLTLDAACWRVASREFKKHALGVCSQGEYDAVVKLVCPSGSSHIYMAHMSVFLAFIFTCCVLKYV